ncbi:Glycosyltransferase involved in cell wall bisynthesis [Fervidobacterium changbaicum]|uniref:Glycosyl transferase family 1 domain-containing protein n=1 Tax=Fervidobacterium changbaicum TaxID=310769 RepID=A0ABX5QTI8_9BACT|nr:glycosyltransferase [Fervidobacterium changbaicum]QAV33755.1 hypothetical protein CBS1_08505 [Fervidobacterium changbaicum]SDH32035.1 Glycosyltransferase involved in cell wall bisynthesis [Fervidobacterium changbaicum]
MRIVIINFEHHGGMKAFTEGIVEFMTKLRDVQISQILVVFTNERKIGISRSSNTTVISLPRKFKLLYYIFPKLLKKLFTQLILENVDVELYIVTWGSHFSDLLLQFRERLAIFVHDARPHDNKRILKMFNDFLLYKRNIKLAKSSAFIITNSETQAIYLREKLRKTVFFLPHPPFTYRSNLKEVTVGLENYYLFFGRIEYYRGVDIFLKAIRILRDQYSLEPKVVIAGRGTFSRETRKLINKYKLLNVHFIDRFIDDDEIPWLFEHCKCVVLPYRSVTQSGPLQLAYKFHKPVIVSALSYFLENFDFENRPGFLVDPGNLENLVLNLLNFERLSKEELEVFEKNAGMNYEKYYSEEKFLSELNTLMQRIQNLLN